MSNEPQTEAAIGQTSEDMASISRKKVDTKLAFGLFDLMALFSLIFVATATLLLFIEIQKFGNVFVFNWPWSVSGAQAAPVVAPVE